MKNITKIAVIALAFLALGSANFNISAQCSGRYFDEIFPGFYDGFLPQLPPTTPFGSAPDYKGNNQNLSMYIFEPPGDTAAKRPLVVLAFGGSFTAGVKESPDILKLCNAFTKRGFVTASIDYRIGADPIDSANMLRAVFRGVQDAKAAVRFFYKDAATVNQYRIDTNHIYMGGTSAGGFVGIHMGYVNDTVEIPQWLNDIIASVGGGLEGNSGNPGYSSKIHGIINLAGAIGDTAWMKPGDPPMVSMHGNEDGTVPYCSEIINVSGNDIIVVDGSATMKERANHIGLQNPFFTWEGADHVPYVNFIQQPAYMDTTIRYIRNFLFEQVTGNKCDQNFQSFNVPLDKYCPGLTSSVSEELLLSENQLAVYPNPASGLVQVRVSNLEKPVSVKVYDYLGKLQKSYSSVFNEEIRVKQDNLSSGLYILTVQYEGTEQIVARRRVVFQ